MRTGLASTFSQWAAVVRIEGRLLRADPSYVLTMSLVPILGISFTTKISELSLQFEGVPAAEGSWQSVPGFLLFGAYAMVGLVAYSMIRDATWRVADRFVSFRVGSFALIAGKCTIPVCIIVTQYLVIVSYGVVAQGFSWNGSSFAFFGVLVAQTVFILGFALLVAGFCRSLLQLNAVNLIGSLVLTGLGGAIVSYSVMPEWAQTIAPASPSYWSMQAFRNVIIFPDRSAQAVVPIVGLTAVGLIFGAIGVSAISRRQLSRGLT